MSTVATAVDHAEMAAKSKNAILFCPFCRECFEGETVCPDHELALVPLEKLPPRPEDARAAPKDDEKLAPFDLRYGRAVVAGGALLAIVSFFLPFLTRAGDGHLITFSAAQLATTVAPNLWTIPFAAVVLLAILARRRTLGQMRGARLVVFLMGLFPAVSAGYTVLRSLRMAQELIRERGAQLEVTVDYGLFVTVAASLVIAAGAFRLGVPPKKETLPHGATPDREGGIDYES